MYSLAERHNLQALILLSNELDTVCENPLPKYSTSNPELLYEQTAMPVSMIQNLSVIGNYMAQIAMENIEIRVEMEKYDRGDITT